jgi:hypothetical protein
MTRRYLAVKRVLAANRGKRVLRDSRALEKVSWAMPKFKVETKSNHNPQDTYSKIKSFLESDQDLRKLDSKLACKFDDAKMNCSASGSQFEADMKVHSDGPGSKVEVTVSLPLLLTPFKGKVQEMLERKLSKVLA